MLENFAIDGEMCMVKGSHYATLCKKGCQLGGLY